VLANTLIFIVAAIHIYILILVMFLWESKTGAKHSASVQTFARETRVMAANQGLYVGFWPPVCVGTLERRAGLSLKRSF
jgi:putative membrane protein